MLDKSSEWQLSAHSVVLHKPQVGLALPYHFLIGLPVHRPKPSHSAALFQGWDEFIRCPRKRVLCPKKLVSFMCQETEEDNDHVASMESIRYL